MDKVVLNIIIYLSTISAVDAVVRSVLNVQPHRGSLNGGTKLTISGTGFSTNQFDKGNTVTLVSQTKMYDCPVSKDGTTEVQILCITVPMDQGDYYIRVAVDGEAIPLQFHCQGNPMHSSCRFTPHVDNTPTITAMVPRTQSASPGGLLQMVGKIMSGVYGSNVASDEILNGVTEKILRVYAAYQLCSLKAGNDVFYGIGLDNNGTSTTGYIICKMEGSFIGNSNASIIVDGQYGRSSPDLLMLRVSAKDEIYMLQTYAEITSISPKTGSTEGGLKLSIIGNNFDKNVKVMIGGTQCAVQSITPQLIVCVTDKQVISSAYPGNRGVMLERWNQTTRTFADLSQVSAFNGNEDNYIVSHIDDFYFEDDMENSVARVRGFFTPPHYGDYTFNIKGNSGARLYLSHGTADDKNPANKVEVVSIPASRTSYQSSARITLQAGKQYYIEAVQQVDSGTAKLQVAAKHLNTALLATMTGFAKQERQKLNFQSTVVREKQRITVSGFTQQTPTLEVQKIEVQETGGLSDAKFQLGLYNVFTEPLTTASTAAAIRDKLMDYPFLDRSESFNVEVVPLSSPGIMITVTFNSTRGEFPRFSVRTTPSSSGNDLVVAVTTTTAGVPSGDFVPLIHAGVAAPLFSPTATAIQVQNALEMMYGTRCSKPLTNPVGKVRFYNYEGVIPAGFGGLLTNKVEPFCGRFVIQNPTYLYREMDDTSKGLLLSTSLNMVCFAYQGGQIQDLIRLGYTYEDLNGGFTTTYYDVPVTFDTVTGWHYFCLNMKTALDARHAMPRQPTAVNFYVTEIRVFKLGVVSEFFIDDVLIGRSAPVSNIADINYFRMLPSKPNGALIESVSVSLSAAGVYDVTLVPHECGYDFPLYEPIGKQVLSGGSVTVIRIDKASPPLTGTFMVQFAGNDSPDVPFSIEGEMLATVLQALPGIGTLDIKRYGDCANFYYIITYLTLPGDVEQIQIDGSGIAGIGVQVTASTIEDGGLWYDPIPGDMLRTFNSKPQVIVDVNDIPSLCTNDCSFEWSAESTPTVTGLTPFLGFSNSLLTITGTGFHATLSNNIVMVGHVPCTPTEVTGTSQLKCTVGAGPKGIETLQVTVVGKGLAKSLPSPKTFFFGMKLYSCSPNTVALGGGVNLTQTGEGFNPDNVTVTINGKPCVIFEVSPTIVKCTLPPLPAGSYLVTVSNGNIFKCATPLVYNATITPVITSVSPGTESVAGGSTISIIGTGFGTTGTLQIGYTKVSAVFTDTVITATLPSMPSGMYKVLVFSGPGGAAVNSSGEVPTILYQLKVTNVFPLTGSLYGGTRITLTGEGFSSSETKVMVGSVGCDILSAEATKIVCEIQKIGNVVEITNQGTSRAFGVGYQWEPRVAMVTVGDTVRWKWTTPSYYLDFKPNVIQTVNISTMERPEDGFISEARPNGMFEYKVSQSGKYYYTSGFIDMYENIHYEGTLDVHDRNQSVGVVTLMVAGHEAIYDVNSGVANPSPSGGCGETTSTIPGCTGMSPSGSSPDKFTFLFQTCSTPVITSFDKNNGTTSDIITLNGEGLSSTNCQNEVIIGDDICTVSSSSQTGNQISCSLNALDSPLVGIQQTVNVRVNNLGNAHITETGQQARTFALHPMISSLNPVEVALNGGALLTITGSGFQGDESDMTVYIDRQPNMLGTNLCDIQSVTYTEITCIIPALSAGTKMVEVQVDVNNVPLDAVCNMSPGCEIEYSQSSTPEFTDVSPMTLAGTLTTVTITGSGFGTVPADIMVTIGGVSCVVTNVIDQQIMCDITNVPVGSQSVMVTRKDKGHASNINNKQVSSSAVITAVFPSEGSIHGGTVIEISGNGFTSNASVTVGGATCTIISITLSMIQCSTPAHAAQTGVPVQVMASGQSYPTKQFDYKSTATPQIVSVNFPSNQYGGTVYINGNGFSATQSQNMVTIGSLNCPVTLSTTTAIQCSAPALPSGTHNIVVNVEGKGLSNTKTLIYDLTLSSIDPNMGSAGGGQKVTLTGSGFNSMTTATICNQECVRDNTASQTATQLVCVVPSAAGTVSNTLTCNVKMDPAQQLTNAYTYKSSLTSTITAVNPRRGGTGGGVTLTIEGTGFGSVMTDVTVTVAGTPCTTMSVSDTMVTCQTGAHTPSVMTKVMVSVGGNGYAVEDSEGDAAFHYVDVWSSPYSWGGGPPPEDGTLVVINNGQTIILDTNTANLKMLLIKGGTLIFDEQDVELKADNILITEGGKLQIGTEEQPHQSKAIITTTAHPRTKELPIYGTSSLGVRDGILDLHGQVVAVPWTKLQMTANAGSNQIKVMDVVTSAHPNRPWQQGDLIVIASTGARNSQIENEIFTIDSIEPDGVTIHLNGTLVYEHLGTSESIGSHTVEYRAEVGMLTRNILLRGFRDPQWTETIEKCQAGFNVGEFAVQTCFQGRFGEEIGSNQFGIQVIVHPPRPNENLAIARVSNVEFNYAGQAFRLGRYPMHFHLGGNMNQSYIKSCALHETFNRAVNIHGSHNILVENNVIYNIMGGAFFLEDGIETGNTFKKNLAVFVRESSSLLNDDVTPAAFWITHPSNTVIQNAAAGGTHFGFWYRLRDVPDGPSRTNTVNPKNAIMGVFKDNTAHSLGWFGLWIFENYFPRNNGLSSGLPTPAVFEDFYAWNCEKGSEAVNAGSVQFKNFRMVNNVHGIEFKQVIEGDYYDITGAMIQDGFIVGRSTILDPVSSAAGIILPLSHRLLVDGVEFLEFTQTSSAAFAYAKITGKSSTYSGGFTTYVKNLHFVNVGPNNRGIYEWEFHGIIKDLDGSLIGDASKANWSVTPTTPILPPFPTCLSFPGFSGQAPASICDPATVKFLRFSFNNIHPTSLDFKDFQVVNENGMSISHWAKKRMTHPKGWMVVLISKMTYTFTWENAEQMTNISFNGRFDTFADGDWIIFRLRVAQKPDCIQTGGICVNETDGALDGNMHYYGDWTYSANDGMISYLVSLRDRNSARKKRSANNDMNQQISMNFVVYKCLYKNCIVPADPSSVAPVDVRPDYGKYWHDPSSWDNGTIPEEGDNVTIKEDDWIVVNSSIPRLGELILNGVLEFEANNGEGGFNSFELRTPYIIITKKGRLIAGFNQEQPFQGNLHIILQGSNSTPNYLLQPDNRDLGSKVIGVFGGLDLNGKVVATSWTTLKVTGNLGDTSITVDKEVDWVVGNEIVVTPTGYSAWETETFKLTAVMPSGGQTVLTLNDTLKFTHLAHKDTINNKTYSFTAEVGLLSHNIIVEGEDYNNLYKESFGGHILIGASSVGIGYARLSNVEFYHMGQEGYTEPYDPRFVVAFVDTGAVSISRPSYVVANAFHHCFSPAIGVYNTRNLLIQKNVIHHTVWWAIQTNSGNTQIKENLVTLTIWEGAYQNRKEVTNVRHNGAISAMEATGLVLENNAVSGAERAGYHVPPHSCDAVSVYMGNIARTCLLGVAFLPTDTLSGTCRKITGFSTIKCLYIGIYYNNGPSLVVDNVCVVDSPIGIFPMVIGPPSVSHMFEYKYVLIKNSLVVGKSTGFDCTNDVIDLSDDNIGLAGTSRPLELNRRLGIIFGQFTSGSNECPFKPCLGIMSYQAINGLTRIEDVTFSGFSNECSLNGAAIATNMQNDDGQHPVEVRRLMFNNVNMDHRLYYHRPNLNKINSADCVDMDCDGLKKDLIIDHDGSLLSMSGAIIPQSEYEWGGDPARGLGDYRIPKTMLTTVSGVRIDSNVLAKYKGVTRNQTCIYHAAWQAYECQGMDYEMLIIESLDSDTETRRISPVAILGHDDDGNGYVDLINGPQDHGWCSGYTCRKRLSTFMALVQIGRSYIIHYTGTTPQNMRYFLLNSLATQAVTIGVWYSQPYRLDVYYQDVHVLPKNGQWKNINGQIIYNLLPENTIGQYVVTPTDPAGSNWFDRDEGMLYFTITGSSHIEIKTVPAVIISFKYPPLSVDEFYGARCVEYLAEFFNLDPSKVRIVNIVSAASGTGRRKRSTADDVLVIEISNEPVNGINDTVNNPLSWEDLMRIYSMAVDEGMLGNFSYVLNGQVLEVSVAKPINPNDPLWATINITTLDGSYRVLVEVDRLAIDGAIKADFEGLPFSSQPKIKVLDAYGRRISELGTEDTPWSVTATLKGGNPAAILTGNTTVQFVKGWANFTNLGINYFGSGYIIDFNISSPSQGENFTVASDPLTIPARQIHAVIVDSTAIVYEQTDMSVTLELRDTVTGQKIEDIAWRSHTWNVDAMLGKPELYDGSLTGTTHGMFHVSNSQASLSSFQVSTYGMYLIKYRITSVPPDYDFYVQHVVAARGKHHRSMLMNQISEIKLKFSENYQTVVGSEKDYVKAYLGNWFGHKFSDIEVLSSYVSPGSIVLTLTVNGTSTTINDTLYATCSIITNGTSGLSYNGYQLTLTPYMIYNGETFYGVKCEQMESKNDSMDVKIAIIVACSMVGLVLIVTIIFCVLWKCKIYPKTKTADIKNGSYYGDIDDILFREKSFMSISSNGTQTAPAGHHLNPGYYRKKTPDIFA